jgi:hypothetical protein
MYDWDENYKKLVPPPDVLRQCHKIIITDNEAGGAGEPFWKIKKWARANCKSFIWMEVSDVSDVSYVWDELATYYFADEKDLLMFAMKYKGGK